MRSYAALAAAFLAAIVVTNLNQFPTVRDIQANEAEDAERLRGFAGYAYGSGDLFIIDDMAVNGFEPFSRPPDSVWYNTTLADLEVELAYIFIDGLLVGGAWLFENTSAEAFETVEHLLIETYGTNIAITTAGELTVHSHQGPDSLILHSLDREADEHEVTYMRIP